MTAHLVACWKRLGCASRAQAQDSVQDELSCNEVKVGGLAGELYHASECGQGIGLDSREDASSLQPEPHGHQESEGLSGGVVLGLSNAGPELAKVVLCVAYHATGLKLSKSTPAKLPRADISGKMVLLRGP